MTKQERTLLRYRLSGELGSDSFESTDEITFLRCFATAAGELAAGLGANAQPNSLEDDWCNGHQMTTPADAAGALAHAEHDETEAERVLLAIAHLRLAASENEQSPVGVPADMRRWRVTTRPERGPGRSIELWAQSRMAATGAAAEALRAETAENAEAVPVGENQGAQ